MFTVFVDFIFDPDLCDTYRAGTKFYLVLFVILCSLYLLIVFVDHFCGTKDIGVETFQRNNIPFVLLLVALVSIITLVNSTFSNAVL